MNKSDRRTLIAASILSASIIAVAVQPSPAIAADWAQDHSDVAADPGILFGKLPNGMRYAIMQNATPKGEVAMRLAIAAGSLEESDAQQGLAHFLEHMAFRGSRHVPENEAWPGLQRLGMGIGADANASTSWTSTLYQFNLPRNDEKTVDGGLMRLRETASELTLAQRAMDDERGVILSEERLRDTPGFRATKALLQLTFPETLAIRRYPIGLTDFIKHAPVSLIRDYYDAFYRPERATLIVVGDIDAKAIQAKIVARFADWKPVGPAGVDPRQTMPETRLSTSALFVDAGAPANIFLEWVAPQEPDSKARERKDLAALVGFQILAYRLQDLATGPQRPFADVSVSNDRLFHLATLQTIQLLIRPQDWRIALAAGITAVRRVEKFGVTADEVKRAEAEIGARLQGAAVQAKTRLSQQVADQIAQSVDEDEVLESPIQELAIANAIFKDLTPDAVNAALRAAMDGHGPFVLVSDPVEIKGGATAVAAALTATEKAPLTAGTAQAQIVWPYLTFGPTGKVVDRKTVPDQQVTFLRFANGVRLTVRPTNFVTGQIVVDVRVGNGRMSLPSQQNTPRWAIYTGFVEGGTKQISFPDMRRVLSGKVYKLEAGMTDNGFMLWGETRPTDLSTQMQVLAAYVSAPGWRTGALDLARTGAVDELGRAGASPSGVLNRDILGLLHDGDRRWVAPTSADLASLKPQAFEKMLAPDLASAPIEITMAGDVTVEAAEQAVATTFGALPRRAEEAAPSKASLAVHMPSATATPIVLHHNGRADQGMAAAAWPTTDAFDVQTVADLRVLKSVLDTRIMDQLRVQEGATYSPDVRLSASRTLPGYGYLLAATELPADKMPLFFSVIASIAADLRAHPVSMDELNRARKPVVESILTQRQTNDYWADSLIGAQTDPRVLDIVRDTVPDLKRVNGSAVQHAAQKFLADAKTWKLEITPAASH